ncbi:hypothetical protein EIP91_000390 [Steccherinum ochraceum]|uniref:Uncharacterized protein n=1 Tax=Steccherinum ochraceum TaxID=92696 RepID=A0A4R0RWG8_9APHY|nr:hypothetical protein EIP91_000390 [Steccherinum ochraceum]
MAPTERPKRKRIFDVFDRCLKAISRLGADQQARNDVFAVVFMMRLSIADRTNNVSTFYASPRCIDAFRMNGVLCLESHLRQLADAVVHPGAIVGHAAGDVESTSARLDNALSAIGQLQSRVTQLRSRNTQLTEANTNLEAQLRELLSISSHSPPVGHPVIVSQYSQPIVPEAAFCDNSLQAVDSTQSFTPYVANDFDYAPYVQSTNFFPYDELQHQRGTSGQSLAHMCTSTIASTGIV